MAVIICRPDARYRAVSKFLDRLPDARQRRLAPQHFECSEKWGRGFSPAHRDADWLEHLAGFDAQALGSAAQRRLQAIVREVRTAKNLAGTLQHALCERRVALLGNQLGGIVRRK